MMHPAVFNTSKIFSEKGIRHVVLSPGSRNAPLIVSFVRNPEIEVHVVVDERSAGFIALGIAQKLQEPVVLCCTSGSAMLNYGPAVAEAWYQEIPLIVVSADRPHEWQGQRDGQTIDQYGALDHFVKKTFILPAKILETIDEWEWYRTLNEATNLSLSSSQPVHINVPFREPFYPDADQLLEFDSKIPVIHQTLSHKEVDVDGFVKKWNNYTKRLIICGQQVKDDELNKLLKSLGDQAVVISDIISNTDGPFIRQHDLLLGKPDPELLKILQPDLIVSFGKSVIAKNLKLFLRKFTPNEHIHFDPNLVHADTFQSMTEIVAAKPHSFFNALIDSPVALNDFQKQVQDNFCQTWKVEDKKINRSLAKTLKNANFSEFTAIHSVMENLPGKIDLHLANSMPVRYANFIQGLSPKTEVFCNRGTSGIDGTNGTAVGNTLVSNKTTVLLTGDLSFFYDRNAFLNQFDLSNLKIIVFNNKGGGIFRLINGPNQLPELEEYFETRHEHTAKFTAMEYGFDYFKVTNESSLLKAMESAFKSNNAPKLIEVFTDPDTNKSVYQQVKQAIVEAD